MQNKNKLPSNQQDAVIYARFSSRRQKEESIEQQVSECRDYAKLNGYRDYRLYNVCICNSPSLCYFVSSMRSAVLAVLGDSFTSGKPAMLVSNDSIPARVDDDATISQFTSENTAEVPIVAIAVCAIVFSARIPAALNQSIVNIFLFMMFNSYSIFFKSINSFVCRFSGFLYCFKLTGQMKHSVRTKMV